MIALIVLGALLTHFVLGMLLVKHTLLRATRRIYAARLAHCTNWHKLDYIDRRHIGQLKRHTYGYVFVVTFFWEIVPFVWWAYVQLRASKMAIDQTIVRADPNYIRGLERTELGHRHIELSVDNIVGRSDREYDYGD